MPEELGRINKRGGAAAKFINEPREFDGTRGDAVLWLKRMDRLKGTAKLSDEEILFVAGDHLVGRAETWFNVIGSKAVTWDAFVVAFRAHYLQDQEDKWWSELQSLKQSPEYPSVDDLALKMQELFSYLDNKSESLQVRTFLTAINKKIACEIEKEGTPKTFELAKEKAKLIERSFNKYSFGEYVAPTSNELSVSPSVLDVSSDTTSVSSMLSLVDKLEKLTINLVKLNNESQSGRVGVAPVRRVLTCFFCNKEGHKKPDCPEFLKQRNLGTGSNAVELGSRGDNNSGKDKGYQL